MVSCGQPLDTLSLEGTAAVRVDTVDRILTLIQEGISSAFALLSLESTTLHG